MKGYWIAIVGGREVARGATAAEARGLAVMQGHDPSQVVVSFVYDIARI